MSTARERLMNKTYSSSRDRAVLEQERRDEMQRRLDDICEGCDYLKDYCHCPDRFGSYDSEF